VWDPDNDEHTVYPKTYGRTLTTETLPDGFANFFASVKNQTHRRLIVQRLMADTQAIHDMISSHESRMFSASIFFVYEGDPDALEEAVQVEANGENDDDDMDEDDEDDEKLPQYISKTKLIDFAHARFCAGEGADHNVLPGVRKVLEHLEMMIIC
jgi:inositol-polyphosphate multikinase